MEKYDDTGERRNLMLIGAKYLPFRMKGRFEKEFSNSFEPH
jgi:hypothetical protein